MERKYKMKKHMIWFFLSILLLPNAGCGLMPEEATQATREAKTSTASAWTETPTSTQTRSPTSTATPAAALTSSIAPMIKPSFTPTAVKEAATAHPTTTSEGGPTVDPRTATVQALLTYAARAQTQAAEAILTGTATPTFTPTNRPTFTPTPTLLPTPSGGASGQIFFWMQETNNTGDNSFDDSFFSLALLDIQSEKLSVLLTSDGETISYYGSDIDSQGKFIYMDISEVHQTSRGTWWNDIIYEYNLETGETRQLSVIPLDPGSDEAEFLLSEMYPDLSPDGSLIVFDSNRDYITDPDPNNYSLYTMDLATHEITMIPGTVELAFRAKFSPDGTQIAYTAWDGDWEIYTQNIDGTNLRKITNNSASDRFPDWSPDGRQLVFHSNRNGIYNLFLYNIESTETTQITFEPAGAYTGNWSPDGTLILFTSDRDGDSDIYYINIETLEIINVHDTDTYVAVPIWVP
jgi:Tol biopolymer transport system component